MVSQIKPSGGRVPIEEIIGLLPQENSGPPISGTGGTLAGIARPGGQIIDTVNGVVYYNEGTHASPVWTPQSLYQPGLFGVHTIFEDGVGVAATATDTETILTSGVRVFGQGIDETDSGLLIQSAGEGGRVQRLTTTNEDAHVAALGMQAGRMQPDQHGNLVIDVDIAVVSALTNKSVFVGFLGTAAAALDPAVTGATTVATLVQDDLAGVWFDAGLTDGDRWFAVHNKSDEAATQDLTADGDTGVNVAAAGTFQRVRVEIDVAGGMTVFINNRQVYQVDEALDANEECTPVLYVEAQTTAVQAIDVRRFDAWASKAAS